MAEALFDRDAPHQCARCWKHEDQFPDFVAMAPHRMLTFMQLCQHRNTRNCQLVSNSFESRLEAIAIRLEAIASRLEVIAIRLEAIAIRGEVIASRLGGHRY